MTDITELINLYDELCIKDFPDDNLVAAFLSSYAARPMTTAEVQRYLHSDPGAGWYIRTSTALYGVTIEQPPFHTCAIRRMTPEGGIPEQIGKVAAAVREYAASISGSVAPIRPNQTQLPGGATVISVGSGVVDATGKPSDTFGIFLSNQHGMVSPPWVEFATPGVGVEVRLTRQVIGR
jgi:hypothetical protein